MVVGPLPARSSLSVRSIPAARARIATIVFAALCSRSTVQTVRRSGARGPSPRRISRSRAPPSGRSSSWRAAWFEIVHWPASTPYFLAGLAPSPPVRAAHRPRSSPNSQPPIPRGLGISFSYNSRVLQAQRWRSSPCLAIGRPSVSLRRARQLGRRGDTWPCKPPR